MNGGDDETLQESIDKLKEAYFHLWGGLLTVNGFLISIGVGLAAFGKLDSAYWIIKALVFVTILSLTISCYLIIYIFYLYVDSYKEISVVLKNAVEGLIPHEELITDKYINITGDNYDKVQVAQKLTFVLQALASIGILITVLYLLFFQQGSQINNQKPYRWLQPSRDNTYGPNKF